MANLKYQGMSRTTGRRSAARDHLFQSIRDILSTPIGTRVLRREYGSDLFELLDKPVSEQLIVDAYAKTAVALDRWEPRFRLTHVRADLSEPGHGVFDLEGIDLTTGESISMEGLVI